MVECKGKGKMKTFWCDIKSGPSSTVSSSNKSFASEESCESISAPTCKKLHVEWIVDVFTKLLKDILMERNAELDSHDRYNNSIPEYSSASSKETLNVLTLPLCKAPRRCEHALSQRDSVVVPTDVAKDMHKFITSIADLHRPNDEFRSLNHSCHTVMSTLKLLHWTEENGAKESSENIGATSSHVYFGPLAKFAVVLGALIQHVAPQTEDPSPVERQDISHPSRRSSAEAENAIAKVWQLLTQEPNQFLSLRRCLCSTTEEWHRFRQVLVHASLSTVVMDANVESMRTSRWETFLAMSKNSSNDQSDFSGGRIESKNSTVLGTKEQISATLAIDLIVQASYFSHGMQHWSVYQKWNRIMWSEQYKAFCLRLCNTDPASVWFEHELQFLDGTVLPLITKLKDCGFFGAASYEGLWDYAVGNRDEWARNGRDIVCEESKGWQGDEGDNDDDHRRAYV